MDKIAFVLWVVLVPLFMYICEYIGILIDEKRGKPIIIPNKKKSNSEGSAFELLCFVIYIAVAYGLWN